MKLMQIFSRNLGGNSLGRSAPVQVGYTSGQLVDGVVMRLEIVLGELRPMVSRECDISDTELYQRAAISIDQVNEGIKELKCIPRARAKGKQHA